MSWVKAVWVGVGEIIGLVTLLGWTRAFRRRTVLNLFVRALKDGDLIQGSGSGRFVFSGAMKRHIAGPSLLPGVCFQSDFRTLPDRFIEYLDRGDEIRTRGELRKAIGLGSDGK